MKKKVLRTDILYDGRNYVVFYMFPFSCFVFKKNSVVFFYVINRVDKKNSCVLKVTFIHVLVVSHYTISDSEQNDNIPKYITVVCSTAKISGEGKTPECTDVFF